MGINITRESFLYKHGHARNVLRYFEIDERSYCLFFVAVDILVEKILRVIIKRQVKPGQRSAIAA